MRVCVLFGTRPEAVKMWPVVEKLREHSVETLVVCTGQHEELLRDVVDVVGMDVDLNMGVMRAGQRPHEVMAAIVGRLPAVLESFEPEWLLVQGDTTSTAAGALAAFMHGIKVAHVEAGLRTHDLKRPFPEEGNRRVVSAVAGLHFAPTERAAENLRAEGIPPKQIHVTGNTVVDALLAIKKRLEEDTKLQNRIHNRYPFLTRRPYVLVTVHRRESFGAPMREIFSAIKELADEFKEHHFIYPVHPNPQVQEAARMLEGHKRILLVEPMDYASFVMAMSGAEVILTDSGGVQEEAPTFGVPVVVLRDVTERPEAVESGWALLGTTKKETILEASRKVLEGEWRRPEVPNPFGDGHAAERIVDALKKGAKG